MKQQFDVCCAGSEMYCFVQLYELWKFDELG